MHLVLFVFNLLFFAYKAFLFIDLEKVGCLEVLNCCHVAMENTNVT